MTQLDVAADVAAELNGTTRRDSTRTVRAARTASCAVSSVGAWRDSVAVPWQRVNVVVTKRPLEKVRRIIFLFLFLRSSEWSRIGPADNMNMGHVNEK
jgi:hypothetical protein